MARVKGKLKGKEWLTILAPKIFGEKVIGETPFTDQKTVINRVVEVSVPELTGDHSKFYMNLKFRIIKTEGNNGYTRFDGYECLKEHVLRNLRRRLQKVEIINYYETKDNWKLQITTVIILNRNTPTTIKKSVRKIVYEFLKENLKKLPLDDFLKITITGILQKKVKNEVNKTYPVRFSEITKIEVIKAPDQSPAATATEIQQSPPKRKSKKESNKVNM